MEVLPLVVPCPCLFPPNLFYVTFANHTEPKAAAPKGYSLDVQALRDLMVLLCRAGVCIFFMHAKSATSAKAY